MSDKLHLLVGQVAAALGERGWMLATAESCTGGWVAKAATDLPGSSQWFERGFITYTNDAKREMLGVAAVTLETHGAVSEETVREMAHGALVHSHAQITLAISGIAGPGGGSEEKPVGMVCLGWAAAEGVVATRTLYLEGDRATIRYQAACAALQGVLDLLMEGA